MYLVSQKKTPVEKRKEKIKRRKTTPYNNHTMNYNTTFCRKTKSSKSK
jgi:hypothetical protein